MKKVMIILMLCLFAGCAWDESGRRDDGRRHDRESSRHDGTRDGEHRERR
jgi:hypothetical protein